jgi:hypothetical protein
MRTSVDTHAPLLTNDSATAVCFRSSRVIRRIKTLVSTARMFFLYELPHSLIELFKVFNSGFSLREDRAVNVFRRIPAGFANDDSVPFLVPFQNRAWADTEFSSHFGWN